MVQTTPKVSSGGSLFFYIAYEQPRCHSTTWPLAVNTIPMIIIAIPLVILTGLSHLLATTTRHMTNVMHQIILFIQVVHFVDLIGCNKIINLQNSITLRNLKPNDYLSV